MWTIEIDVIFFAGIGLRHLKVCNFIKDCSFEALKNEVFLVYKDNVIDYFSCRKILFQFLHECVLILEILHKLPALVVHKHHLATKVSQFFDPTLESGLVLDNVKLLNVEERPHYIYILRLPRQSIDADCEMNVVREHLLDFVVAEQNLK